MSSGVKRPLDAAEYWMRRVRQMLQVPGVELRTAGSVRRKMGLVGDLEIVAVGDTAALWEKLDVLLAEREIRQALYGDKGLTRWGEKYRGFVWAEWRIEVFSTVPENVGYVYWLRTGPGEANRYVMDRLKKLNSPARALGGLWHVGRNVLPVPDEETMFRDVLNIPYIPPVERTLRAYQREMTRRGYRPCPMAQDMEAEPETKQRGLFD